MSEKHVVPTASILIVLNVSRISLLVSLATCPEPEDTEYDACENGQRISNPPVIRHHVLLK
jgi:hypothetical protein